MWTWIWDALRTVQTEVGVMAQWDLFLYLYVLVNSTMNDRINETVVAEHEARDNGDNYVWF